MRARGSDVRNRAKCPDGRVFCLRRRAARKRSFRRWGRPPKRSERHHLAIAERQGVHADGPYAETKEQLGGILVLEARDLNHAIQLMSKHPGVKAGPFEIRAAEDLTEMIRESELRRSTNAKK